MNGLTRDARALIDASRLHYQIGVCDKARIRRKLTHRLSATAAAGTLITTAVLSAEAARATVPLVLWGWAPSAVKALAMVVFVGATTASGVSMWRASAPSATKAPSMEETKRTRAAVASEPRFNVPTPRDTPPSDGADPSSITPPSTSVSNLPSAASNVPSAASNVPRDIAKVHSPAAYARTEPVTTANAMSRTTAGSSNSRTADRRRVPPNSALESDADARLLGRANALRDSRAALQRGDAQAALATLNQWLPSGSGGELEQESLYLRVSAYCQLRNSAQARHFADLFLSRFAGSFLEHRVHRSCAFAGPPVPP